MSSQLAQPCPPADLWHQRLNQTAHRLSCVGWLLLVGVAFPAKLPAALVAALAIWAAIVAVVCSAGSTLVVRPDDGNRREAIGALAFSLALLITGWIVAMALHLAYMPHLIAWLRMDLNPMWLRWSVRGAAMALVAWIGIVTAIHHRGRQ